MWFGYCSIFAPNRTYLPLEKPSLNSNRSRASKHAAFSLHAHFQLLSLQSETNSAAMFGKLMTIASKICGSLLRVSIQF